MTHLAETMRELADRCEAAMGPDCCLDFCIYEALGNEYAMLGKFGVWRRAGAQWPATADSVPPYTASLDAAMTLVPEGWGYNICPKSVLLTRSVEDSGVMGRAATPALALTAACLKARAAMAETK